MKVIDAVLRCCRVLGLALFLMALQIHSAAAAPSSEERERARALMDLGDARFEAKNYGSALEQYRAADEIMNVPTTGIEVGRTLERLGRLLEARETLRKVSEFPQRADEPRPFASARQRADRLLGDIAPRIPRVTLQVSGLPEGTTPEITWDGQRIDDARVGGYLEANPGVHHVSGKAAGFPDVKRDVRLAEGQALQVELAFGRAPAPDPGSPTVAERPTAPVAEVAKRDWCLFFVAREQREKAL
jgi:tetratricopeptide (TPR) repeat protein